MTYIQTPTISSHGRMPSSRFTKNARPASSTLALTVTPLLVTSPVSSPRSMKAGTCVLKRVTSIGFASPGGS